MVGCVTGLDAAVYRYEPRGHRLAAHLAGDQRTALAAAAFGQSWVAQGAVVLVIAAAYQRSSRQYGKRAPRCNCCPSVPRPNADRILQPVRWAV